MRGGRREHRVNPVVVEAIAVHRRKQGDDAQVLLAERASEPRVCVGRDGVEHEEPDEPRGVPSNRGGDGLLVAGNAGDEAGAIDPIAIELGDPAVGEALDAARRVPAQRRSHGRGAVFGGEIRGVSGQDLEETRREEVAMRVAQHHRAL